jgi:hypothetical protein
MKRDVNWTIGVGLEAAAQNHDRLLPWVGLTINVKYERGSLSVPWKHGDTAIHLGFALDVRDWSVIAFSDKCYLFIQMGPFSLSIDWPWWELQQSRALPKPDHT